MKKGILTVERRYANEKKDLDAIERRYANEEKDLDVVKLSLREENEARAVDVGEKSMIYGGKRLAPPSSLPFMALRLS